MNKTTKRRLGYILFCLTHRDSRKHAAYLKKHHIFKAMGEDCRFQPYVIPQDAKHITFHNNVGVGTGVQLICHDALQKLLNNKYGPDGKKMPAQKELPRNVKDIEIFDNVQIGANAIICAGVRIGPNAVVSAGAVVTKDVPPDSIVAGNPAQIVGSFSVIERIRRGGEEIETAEQAQTDERAKKTLDAAETENRVLKVLSENINGIDFAHEEKMLDDGLIDSLSMISIVTLLEEHFQCRIPFQKINAENFNSVHAMAKMLTEMGYGEETVSASGLKAEAAVKQPLLELSLQMTKESIVERIMKHALTGGNDVAIIANDKETTYQELADMILSVSAWLKKQGIVQGDRVVVQALHRDLCIACYYSVQLLGAVLVPVEKTAAQKRILEIAEDTSAKYIISMTAQNEKTPWTSYEQIDKISHTAVFDANTKLDFPNIDLPCEMIFTTGTTGKSKGVLIAHKHMAWYAYAIAKRVEMRQGNRFLLTTPLNHAGGLRRTHLMLANGCCMVYVDGMSDLGKYFSYIDKYSVTSLYLPPVTIRILLTRAKEELGKYKNQIDFVYSSSSPLPAGDCEELRKVLPFTRLYNAYEASETPGVSAYDYNTDDMKNGCLGPANEGAEFAILKEDGQMTNQAHCAGRICVKSRMNMIAYDHEPELTASVLKDGWFVSSDLGYLDENGNIFYSGREGDVINIGGYKIAPTEVEEVALMSGLCRECVCIESFDEYEVPFIKLLVVPNEGTFDSRKLLMFMTDRLEAYKIPRKIEMVDAVEKTFNGKINRKAYRKK